ncbi:MAG: hypothetical protein NDI61_08800 [Bdellovibrionaceae bacterium]|nr:hypothetical protein [Pseudobdellovibrionaceae bacterium]
MAFLAMVVVAEIGIASNTCRDAFRIDTSVDGKVIAQNLAREIQLRAARESLSVHSVLSSPTIQAQIRSLSRKYSGLQMEIKSLLQKSYRGRESTEPVHRLPKNTSQKVLVRTQGPYRKAENLAGLLKAMPDQNGVIELEPGFILSVHNQEYFEVLQFHAATGKYAKVDSFRLRGAKGVIGLKDGRIAMIQKGNLVLVRVRRQGRADAQVIPLPDHRLSFKLCELANGDIACVGAKQMWFFREGRNGQPDQWSAKIETQHLGEDFSLLALTSGEFLTKGSKNSDVTQIWGPDLITGFYRPHDADISLSHRTQISGLLQLKEGWVLSVGHDDQMKLYARNGANGFSEVDSLGLSGGISSVAELPDGRIIVTTKYDGWVRLFKIGEGGKFISSEDFVHGHAELGTGVTVLSNGDFITWDSNSTIWDSVFRGTSRVKRMHRWHSSVSEQVIEVQPEEE